MAHLAALACAEMPSHSRRPSNMSAGPASVYYTCNNRIRIKVSIRVRVSLTTRAVRSAIIATAGLLVYGGCVNPVTGTGRTSLGRYYC